MEINIYPVPFHIFGHNVGLSVIISWCVLAVVIALLALANLHIKRKYRERPKGLQNVLEMVIGGIEGWAKTYVGHAAPMIAPITLTFMLYVFSTSIIELFGLPAAASDFNCALGLGLTCFIAVNVTAIRYRGPWERIKAIFKPNAVVAPIRLLTDLITPFSMAIRLFSNILVGAVIMEMVYNLFPIVLPAVVSSFFTVVEIGIQVFVFGLLSLIYTSEAVE